MNGAAYLRHTYYNSFLTPDPFGDPAVHRWGWEYGEIGRYCLVYHVSFEMEM